MFIFLFFKLNINLLFSLKTDFIGLAIVISLILIGYTLKKAVLGIYILLGYKKSFKESQVRIFHKYARLNQKNLLKATVCLAMFMLIKDRIDFLEKLKYIKKYFYKKHKTSYHYFPLSFNSYYKKPATIESVCFWLNKKLVIKQDRINLLYFIAGISMIDGQLTNSECLLLKEIQERLNLDKKDLDAIIAMYTSHEEHQKEENNKNSITNNERRTKAKIEVYCTILEIPSSSTFEEIKKAYRKLAMLNHPDKYEKAGPDMVNIAKERFLKIQEAYEYLEKIHIYKK